MTMPLVQLGPGGDYIRRIVPSPSKDRLQSVTRPFSLTDAQGRLVSRPNGDLSRVGPIAWLLATLQAIGLIQLRESETEHPTARTQPRSTRRRRIGISSRTARKFSESAREQVLAIPSKHQEILDRIAGGLKLGPKAKLLKALRAMRQNRPR